MNYIPIPMKKIGPVKIIGKEFNIEVLVPLATFETTIYASAQRGARATYNAGGINCILIYDSMSRSICMEAKNAMSAIQIKYEIEKSYNIISMIISSTSSFASLESMQIKQIGSILYIRINIKTGNASGHNMVTKAADALIIWLLEKYSKLKYISVSGNFCTDKKVSAVNPLFGRGKSVIADIIIPDILCQKILRTNAKKIVDLNIKKNLLGSIQAGSLLTANAHYANLLLATYLATGQDAANIVEGSQGITYAKCDKKNLYFSVNIPNIIVGTVGHGKDHSFIKKNLLELGCLEKNHSYLNSRKLAIIIAATVLCGELSLLASLTNIGELMKAHQFFERRNK